MDYCILVTISRNTISFRYNRVDGDNRFVDFPQDGAVEIPFAIECVGNDFVIGKRAFEAATKNLAPNAFANIFDTCKEMKTFRFAGRDEQVNKLPFYAIKYYLSKILSDCFYGEKGTIDSNVSKLPLIFLFTPELDTDKKLFISSPFERGGFQNLCSMSYHQLLLPTIMNSLPESQRKKAVVMVSVDERDLLLHIYDSKTNKEIGDAIRIDGQGCDPRLKQAADLIWNRLYYYNYQPREQEDNILKEAALRFLNSNENSINDRLCMSDGSMQDYYLSRGELDISPRGEAYRLISYHLNSVLSNNDLQIQQCQIILVGNAATDYFDSIFNQMPSSVPIKKVLAKEKNQMLSQLLSMVKEVNYEVSKLFPSNRPKVTAPPVVPAVLPSLTDKKHVRTIIADIKGKVRSNDYKGALDKYEELKAWLIQNHFSDWDVELQALERDIKKPMISESESPKPDKPQMPAQKETKVPLTDDVKIVKRDARRTLADIKAKARNGRKEEALKSLIGLEESLHRKRIVEFDSEMERIMQEYALLGSEKIPLETKKNSSANKNSKAECLLLQGNFKEAKRQYALEGNSNMAQECSKLIKVQKDIELYASGLESARRSRNPITKRNAIKEMEDGMALYQKYALATKEIEQLIEQYKTI